MPNMNPKDIVAQYLSTWNETDPTRRRALIRQHFAPAARYVDPLVASQGHDELHAIIGAVQAQFPKHRFTPLGSPQTHGAHLRFSWSLARPGSGPVALGTDFAELDGEGRLSRITGFLDPVPRRTRAHSEFAYTSDGETLFCRDTGVGDPVVLVHAWGLSSAMWQYQTPALVSAGFRCISFDRRGHGRSSPAAAGYDYERLAEDLHTVLGHHDLDGVTLVGHSMGCAEILRYLGRYGSSRIARIALIAPLAPVVVRTPDNPEGVPPEAFERLWSSWRHDFPAWVEANRRPFFTENTSSAVMSWLAALLLDTPLDVLLATSEQSVVADLRGDLSAVDCPALVVHGDRDASVPFELGRRTATGIRGAHFSAYEGAPHGLFVTHAARLNEELVEFIRAPS